MLNKINKIKNVGEFSNSTPSNITLNKDILVYARNTHGKSTFTDIFHSLKNNNPEILIGRKTIPSSGDQEVVIELGGKIYRFFNNQWTENFSDIEIFDTKFISENISHLEQITSEQQKNLNQIILGEQGKKINDNILNLTSQITINGTKKAEFTKSLKILGINKSFEELKKLDNIENVDLELENISNRLSQIKSKEEIKKIRESYKKLDFSDEELSLLSKKFELDNKVIEAHILSSYPSDHKNLDNSFVEKGLELSKNNICAFCGNEFIGKSTELILAYQTLFSEEFKRYQKSLRDLKEKIKNYNFHSWSKIVSELATKRIQLTSPNTDLLEIKKREIIDIIDQKLIDFTKSYDSLPALSEILDIQNSFYEELNKIDLEIASSEELEKRKLELELNKQIFSTPIQEEIKAYEDLEKQNNELEDKRKSLQESLDQYCESIYQDYRNEINQILNQIHSNFKLENFKHLKKLRGKDDAIFEIGLNGCLISVYESNNSKPNFKNTLSESDKKALAFAFFVVKLKKDPDLDKKIIVFDDPISSFDAERKRKTAEIILNLKNDKGKKPLQKIILTHEELFLMEIYKKSKASEEELQSLEIIKGNITSCNFEEKFCEEVFKDLKFLSEIRENYKGEDFEIRARTVLENIFKRKYYEKIAEIKKENPSASVRSFVKEVYVPEEERYTKGILLCDSLNIECHDNPEVRASEGDRLSVLKDFFEFLKIL